MFETLESLRNAGAQYDVNDVNIILGENYGVHLIHYDEGWRFEGDCLFLSKETFFSINEFAEEMKTHWEGFKGFWFRYNLWRNMLKMIAQAEGFFIVDNFTWGFGCKYPKDSNDYIRVLPVGLDEIKLYMHVHGGMIPSILITGDKAKIIDSFKSHCKTFKEFVDGQAGDIGKTQGIRQHQV